MSPRDEALMVLLEAWLIEARLLYRWAAIAPELPSAKGYLSDARTALAHATQLARAARLLDVAPLDLRLADGWIEAGIRAKFG